MTDDRDHPSNLGCWLCGQEADLNLPTGPPEHVWRWWCRPCLALHRAGLGAASSPAEDDDE